MVTPSAKSRLRATVEVRLDRMDPGQRRTEAAALVETLERWLLGAGFDAVLATLPLANEADLTPALGRWLAAGHALALARTGPGRSLDFGYVDNLDGPWEPRPYGLREPSRSAPAWTGGPKTLCLVPGLAFAPADDGSWARLGRGAGYYDRWLAVHGPEVFTLGFGYAAQRVAEVPTEDHDYKLYGWLGPAGVELSTVGLARIPSQNTE